MITSDRAQVSEIAKTLKLFVAASDIGEIRVIGSGTPFGIFFRHESCANHREHAGLSIIFDHQT